MAVYDVIVVGLGGMGSAAACHLARRGRRVHGRTDHDISLFALDRFARA